MHPCNAGELPDASRHHQCITTSGADTPLLNTSEGRIEHDALYMCDAVNILQYAGLPDASVPGILTPSVHQTPLIGMLVQRI